MTANLQFEVARRSQALLVPNQALRWSPIWNQITPAARGQFPAPKDRKAAAATVDVEEPTVWVLAEDGLVRPVVIQTGLTDGVVTEVLSGELEEGAALVVGRTRQAKRDFVSSFMSRVTGKGNANE
jgi:HlyD family secretion protein